MRHLKQSEGVFVLRVDAGEPVVQRITDFAVANDITAGELRAIGAIRDFELGYYRINEKEYTRQTFQVNAEIISMIGNFAVREGKHFAHIHIAAGLPDFSVVGGHLFEGIVSATAEVTMHKWPVGMKRKFDDKTGLYLLDLNAEAP